MVKFKRRSGMKQYIKSKPIKWGFKFWFRFSFGYLYQMDIYLGKKQNTEFNLSEEVVLKLNKTLEGSFGTVYFDNFLSSPILIENCLRRTFMLSELFKNQKKNAKNA